jgi:hypothetical protein
MSIVKRNDDYGFVGVHTCGSNYAFYADVKGGKKYLGKFLAQAIRNGWKVEYTNERVALTYRCFGEAIDAEEASNG